jgi:hypothetical protein
LRGRSENQPRTRKLILMTVGAASDAQGAFRPMQALRQMLET